MSNRKVVPWRVLSSRISFADRWLRVRTDRCETGHGARVEAYHVLESGDWVNIVALTRDGCRLLLAREYRHGRGEIVIGLVGGSMEPTDGSVEAAARRELLEETGYGGGVFMPVLTGYANAARQNNLITTFLAVAVAPVSAPCPDGAETVEVIEDDLAAVLLRLQRGEQRMQVSHIAALWSAAATILAVDVPGAGVVRDRLRSALSPQ